MMRGAMRVLAGGFGVVACCLALLQVGCEEDVTAVLGTERVFSLYGVFSPEMDTQWVRVFPIEPRLEPTRPEPLDARLTTQDLQTGEVRQWRDSLIREADGEYGHVFWSKFRAAHGHTYRLQAERADGRASRVEVAVPPMTEIVLQEPRAAIFPIVVPVLVRGAAPRLMRVEVEYWIKYDFTPEGSRRIALSYEDRPRKTDEGWMILVNLSEDYRILRERMQTAGQWNADFGLVPLEITLRFAVVNEAWAAPGGVFDPNVLVQPGVMSNVENGFGFVGAGYRLYRRWLPESSVLKAAGFKPLSELSGPGSS